MRIAAAALCACLPLAPWIAWSHARAGSVAAPYASSPGELLERVARGHYFTRSPASGVARASPGPLVRPASILRLPYDVVFRSSRFEANGNGYNGLLPLLLLVGLAGWDVRRNLPVSRRGAALSRALVAARISRRSDFSFPSILSTRSSRPRGSAGSPRRFSGASGRAAGAAVLAAAAAFPVHFGSSGLEWKSRIGPRDSGRSPCGAASFPGIRRSVSGRRTGSCSSVRTTAFTAPREPSGGASSRRWPDGRTIPSAGVAGSTRSASPPSSGATDRAPFAVLERLGDRLTPAAEHGPARLFEVAR